MSLLQYTITNQSANAKTFTYFSASIYHTISVGGFGVITFEADDSFPPSQNVTGVPEDTFLSDSYIPPSGSAWLWNNGNKIQYIKISNTPSTGSNVSPVLNKAEWIEFSMLAAKNKDGNLLFPTSPTIPSTERYTVYSSINRGSYSSININSSSPETSTAVSANALSAETGFSYIDQQFTLNQDCNPVLNNATEPRTNDWLQDVDYSINAITPVNFNQIINFTATKAAIPQSNYTQLGFVNSRYVGSSTTRDNINEYNPTGSSDPINKFLYSDEPSSFFVNKGKGPTFGKIPNVELNNAYIAYFNRIIDPYPLLNNKVAYYVKYLIDESGNVLDPNISDINFSIFKDTFQLKDYDSSPTRVNTVISNIDQGKELVKLTDGLSPVYSVGNYPVPILYTQTSSIGYANSIPLAGKQFFTALGIDPLPDGEFIRLGLDIYTTQSITTNNTRTIAANLPDDSIEWSPSDITPKKSNTLLPVPPNLYSTNYATSSALPTQAFLFPLDSLPKATPINSRGGTLSDNYIIEGNFSFTTSTIPGKYTGGASGDIEKTIRFFAEKPISKRNDFGDLFEGNPFDGTYIPYSDRWFLFKLSPYVKPPNEPSDTLVKYVQTNEGFKVNKIELVITTNPGGTNQFIHSPLEIEKDTKAYGVQWRETSTGLSLSPNSYYIEELIIKSLGGDVNNTNDRLEAANLIGGGWFTDGGGNNYGYGSIPVKYDWVIDFEFNNVKQGTGVFFKYSGTMSSDQNDAGKNTRPRDIFLFFGENGERKFDLEWKRTFSPTYATGVNTKPIIKYSVTSPYSEITVTNAAPAPFWRRYPEDPDDPNSALTPDQLYLSSSILNQAYGRNFVQAKLPYSGSVNTDFPTTVEPDFIEFDPVTDIFQLEEGDEIRFENKESLTYKIVNITLPKGRDPISEDIKEKIRITISPPFNAQNQNPNPYNFDFFVIRRYKNNKNFIILNQQMPYGVISTGKGEVAFSGEDGFVGIEPVSPSSSPGLLLPQYRVGTFNVNPDLVLKDLIEKRIIT
jgi:hypothetical protein